MPQEILTNLKLLEEIGSPFQNIRLYQTENNRLMLTLNSKIQFVEGEGEFIVQSETIQPTI